MRTDMRHPDAALDTSREDLGRLVLRVSLALELQGMYFFAAIALALLGAGRYSLGGRAGKWN